MNGFDLPIYSYVSRCDRNRSKFYINYECQDGIDGTEDIDLTNIDEYIEEYVEALNNLKLLKQQLKRQDSKVERR